MTIGKMLLRFCRVTMIILIGIVSLIGARAPLQELVVRCSSDELRQLQTTLGAAIVDAIPAANSYLIAVSSQISPTDIKAMNDDILMSRNVELDVDKLPAPGGPDS